MKPDLLIIGDSHSAALRAGCDQLRIACLMASFSGAVWHDGHITYHDELGITSSRKWASSLLDDIRTKLGARHLARAGVPVLFSVGFHLGRLVPGFGWNGHRVFRSGAEVPGDRMAVSSGLLRDYISEFRSSHFELIEGFARDTAVTVVAPPPLNRENYAAFSDAIVEEMERRKLRVFDPRGHFADESGALPEELLEADQVHGNAEYGRLVMKKLIEESFLQMDNRAPA